jgi:hypothetical protein
MITAVEEASLPKKSANKFLKLSLLDVLIKTLPLSLLGLACLLAVSGCSPEGYYRTKVTSVPCVLNCDTANLVNNSEHDYTLGFVELDDQGQFYDRGQVEALIKWLKNEKQPQYVTIFVHGWHHNAQENDFNVRRFKEALKDLKQRNPGYKVTGIYVGWRGETLTVPWLRALTFWNRKEVSEEVGRNSLLDFLLHIETVVKPEGNSQNKLLTVGHSLGASVLFNALHQVLLQRLVQPENAALRTGFGDLVVLVNPAFEAMRFASIRDAAQRYNHEFGFGDQQNPLLLIATSEADTTTKNTFSMSRKLTALFEQHRSFASTADPALSEWELDTTAIGHFSQFITHRLQANKPGGEYNCATSPGWLNATVVRQRQLQANTGKQQTGQGWSTGDGQQLGSLFGEAANMQLQHLNNSAGYDPYWVIQTDNIILPNHGFVNQKLLWCFIDLTINEVKRNQVIVGSGQ